MNNRLDWIRFVVGLESESGDAERALELCSGPHAEFTRVAFVPADEFKGCRPMEEVRLLFESKQLRRLRRRWGRDPGDCHKIALGLHQDLLRCHWLGLLDQPFDWKWMTGERDIGDEHSWLESRGWAIDASHGLTDPVRAIPVETYRKWVGVQNVHDGYHKPPLRKVRRQTKAEREAAIERFRAAAAAGNLWPSRS
jgi:hypothetical protein